MSIYAELGSPALNFYSFWDVYNQLHDAVDSDFLERTSARHESMSEDEDTVEQPPLSELRPCVFGENGVPAGWIEEGEVVTSFLICFLTLLPPLQDRLRLTDSVMTDQVGHHLVVPSTQTHAVLMSTKRLISKPHSQMMRAMNCTKHLCHLFPSFPS